MQVARESFSLLERVSGARVSNAWVIYPRIGDNIAKVMLIPNEILKIHVFGIKDGLYIKLLFADELAYH